MAREPGVGQRGGQIVCGQRAALKFAFKKINLVRSLDQNILLLDLSGKKAATDTVLKLHSGKRKLIREFDCETRFSKQMRLFSTNFSSEQGAANKAEGIL